MTNIKIQSVDGQPVVDCLNAILNSIGYSPGTLTHVLSINFSRTGESYSIYDVKLTRNDSMLDKALFTPSIEFHGPAAFHNMPCPVHHGYILENEIVLSEEPAVLSNGIFQPSWKAQAEGYRIVKLPKAKWKRLLLKLLLEKV